MTGVSGIASAIARKCAYKPSWVGLLYQGATCSTASAPASRARCEYSIAAAVELLPVPAITRARPRATSIVSAITLWSSASVIVALSPVVPHGTSRRTPPVIWRSTSARIRSSSIAPPAVNGVTSAVAQPRIQSTFIVMIQTPYFYGTISEIRFVCSSVRSTMFIASSISSAKAPEERNVNLPLLKELRPILSSRRTMDISLLTERASQNVIKDLGKLEHTLPTNNPLRRDQSPGSETFTTTGDMRDRYLIGHRIKAEPVRSGNVTRAGRRDRDVVAQFFGDDLVKLHRGARRRVAFAFVVRLFDETVVRFEIAKQFRCARRNAIEYLHADREVRAIDQGAVMVAHHAPDFRELRQPTRRAHNDRNSGKSASFGVLRNAVGNGKVDRHIAPAQRFCHIFDAAIGVFNIERQRDFMALLNGQSADQLTHRAVSDQGDFHQRVPSASGSPGANNRRVISV